MMTGFIGRIYHTIFIVITINLLCEFFPRYVNGGRMEAIFAVFAIIVGIMGLVHNSIALIKITSKALDDSIDIE